ncbi:MAG: hypothetical protein WCL06_06620, partial [Bacteroidota bacterium]
MKMRKNNCRNLSAKLSGIFVLLLFFILSFSSAPVSAQKAVKELRAGNSLYEKGDYKAAEISYR